MNYEIRLTPDAKADLRVIFEYIAYNLQSVKNAAGQLDRLEQSIASLDRMPERFRIYEKQPWHSRNLRIMPVDNYLIFYIPDCEEHIVTVIRVLYGGRDVDRQLNKNPESFLLAQNKRISAHKNKFESED